MTSDRPVPDDLPSVRPASRLMLRRHLLTIAATGPLENAHDAVELLREAGEDKAADLLAAVVRIVSGIPSARSGGGCAQQVAKIELRHLATLLAADPPSASHAAAAPGTAEGRIALIVDHLEGDTAPLTQAVAAAMLALARSEPASALSGDAPLHDLGCAAAARRLGAHLRRTTFLWRGALAAPNLFHAAARLRFGALGPWFSSVSFLCPRAEDLTALVRASIGDAADPQVWRLMRLVAQGYDDIGLGDLMNDFADDGRLDIVSTLLCDRLARGDPPRAEPLLTARDAALDLGAAAYAGQVQRWRAERDPGQAREWMILARMEIAQGNRQAAQDALAFGCRLDPRDEEMFEALRAVRRGEPAVDFPIAAGLHSSPKSQARRACWRTGAAV